VNATWLDTWVSPWRRRAVLRSSHTRDDIHLAELDEATIRYREAGTGPRTLVLCTDPPVGLEMYDTLLPMLAARFRTIVFEPPAFGYSLPRAGMGFELNSIGRITGRFLQHVGASPAILAFPCVTAYAALWLARHEPLRVDGLILMQAPDWHEELRWKQQRDPKNLLGRPWLGQLLMKALKRRRIRAWYASALGRRELLAPYIDLTQRAFDDGAGFSLASAFQRLLSGAEPAFGHLDHPALVFVGTRDPSHRHTDFGTIRRYLPQARIVELAQAGHFPELEAPDAFCEAVFAQFKP
jgi:pimeloyl-ACP methyl ester carboxylesterase